MEKLEIIPHCEIHKILRISYDSLQDDHDRDLFLEIACFFCGEAKSFVVGILDECDYYTLIILKLRHTRMWGIIWCYLPNIAHFSQHLNRRFRDQTTDLPAMLQLPGTFSTYVQNVNPNHSLHPFPYYSFPYLSFSFTLAIQTSSYSF